MPVLVSPTDPRGSAAVELVVADEWKVFHDAEGRVSFGVPAKSRRGGFYRTTDTGCTCPDLKYRPWLVCKHMLAVRLQLEMYGEEQYAF